MDPEIAGRGKYRGAVVVFLEGQKTEVAWSGTSSFSVFISSLFVCLLHVWGSQTLMTGRHILPFFSTRGSPPGCK